MALPVTPIMMLTTPLLAADEARLIEIASDIRSLLESFKVFKNTAEMLGDLSAKCSETMISPCIEIDKLLAPIHEEVRAAAIRAEKKARKKILNTMHYEAIVAIREIKTKDPLAMRQKIAETKAAASSVKDIEKGYLKLESNPFDKEPKDVIGIEEFLISQLEKMLKLSISLPQLSNFWHKKFISEEFHHELIEKMEKSDRDHAEYILQDEINFEVKDKSLSQVIHNHLATTSRTIALYINLQNLFAMDAAISKEDLEAFKAEIDELRSIVLQIQTTFSRLERAFMHFPTPGTVYRKSPTKGTSPVTISSESLDPEPNYQRTERTSRVITASMGKEVPKTPPNDDEIHNWSWCCSC